MTIPHSFHSFIRYMNVMNVGQYFTIMVIERWITWHNSLKFIPCIHHRQSGARRVKRERKAAGESGWTNARARNSLSAFYHTVAGCCRINNMADNSTVECITRKYNCTQILSGKAIGRTRSRTIRFRFVEIKMHVHCVYLHTWTCEATDERWQQWHSLLSFSFSLSVSAACTRISYNTMYSSGCCVCVSVFRSACENPWRPQMH